MKFGIVVFPGTWSEHDTQYAVQDVLGQPARLIWHKETDISDCDAIVLPGGFSYGDYLRCGAIARFSPIMESVRDFAGRGGPVIGICNGFQVLCEAGLLPGALVRNEHLEFRCEWVNLRVERTDTVFTSTATKGQLLHVPISHGEGNWQADTETVKSVESNGQVLLRYADASGNVSSATNPNGSTNGIAGIINERGNVLGLMPHPEKACEELIGGADGNVLFESIIRSAAVAISS
ncbi:MAG: phosphoribosylformylglycinamidine synthase subunit PurQ [Chloroflexi bacterium]|nr:phosphoribosylformylglycinamidine synthase subunit PurQ [Chloroflexota bacterium]